MQKPSPEVSEAASAGNIIGAKARGSSGRRRQSVPTEEENKVSFRRYLEEAWNQSNLEVVDEIFDRYISHQPAREVAGDLYDFFELEDGRLGVVEGDATGKGMPAALAVSATCSTLRAVAQALGSSSAGEVLSRVNETLLAPSLKTCS
jgi:Stage II sporulation protein E (SpoIIE)